MRARKALLAALAALALGACGSEGPGPDGVENVTISTTKVDGRTCVVAKAAESVAIDCLERG